MCDHVKVVVVYDAGGTYKCCGDCGKQLSDWQQNSGSGKHKRLTKEEKEQEVQRYGIIDDYGIHV
jgi:hypothetical protein